MANRKYPWNQSEFTVPCDGELTKDGGKLATYNRVVAAANYRTRMYGERWACEVLGEEVMVTRTDGGYDLL